MQFAHSVRGDCVSPDRAAGAADARGLLAAIATLVVMQSTLGATLTLSRERIVAAAPTVSTTDIGFSLR